MGSRVHPGATAFACTWGLLGVGLLVVLSACSESRSPTDPAPPVAELSLSMQTEHFLLRYSEHDSSKMVAYGNELEANYRNRRRSAAI